MMMKPAIRQAMTRSRTQVLKYTVQLGWGASGPMTARISGTSAMVAAHSTLIFLTQKIDFGFKRARGNRQAMGKCLVSNGFLPRQTPVARVTILKEVPCNETAFDTGFRGGFYVGHLCAMEGA
jgi:hypothetical protein